jgi:tyrosyl-tRNA synthetase
LHGEKAAREAEAAFENTFAKGGVPDDVQEVNLAGELLADALVKAGVVPSKAEWRRLIDGGGIKTEDDEKITDPHFNPAKTMILKVGKRRFVKVIV